MTTCKRNSKDYTTCVDAATEKFQCSKKEGYYEGPCEYRGEGNAILLAVKIIVKLWLLLMFFYDKETYLSEVYLNNISYFDFRERDSSWKSWR